MRHGVAIAAALVLATGGLALNGARPAVAALCPGVKGDVNGDGLAEVAIGEPGNVRTAGSVHVLYGRPAGLVSEKAGTALDDQYFSRDTPGVPGKDPEPGDDHPAGGLAFGENVAFGDFNADGCADLAIGSSGGDITILYGSPRGLMTKRAQRLVPYDLLGPKAKIKATGADDLEVADLDDDGIDDLAIDAADTATNDGGVGAVLILFGDRDGLNKGSTKAELVHRDTPGVPGKDRDSRTTFASELTSGDFDGDGHDELAVFTGNASVQILERGQNGWGKRQPTPLGPSTAGFPKDRSWKHSTWAVAAGDVNGDGRSDLAIGNPNFGCAVCDKWRTTAKARCCSCGDHRGAWRPRATSCGPRAPAE